MAWAARQRSRSISMTRASGGRRSSSRRRIWSRRSTEMPNTVSLDEVRHVARLARLGLTEEQVSAGAPDLNTILAHMDVLSKIDTQGAHESTAAPAAMPLRVDHGALMPLDAPAESFGPEMRDGFFVVPRLATHEDAEP